MDVGCNIGTGVAVDVDVNGIAVGASVFIGMLVAASVLAF